MKNSANAFAAAPDINRLQNLRQLWENAYTEWQGVELFDFGPAEVNALRNFFNIYPADVTGILNNISNTSANLEVPASYPQQGFPALDYLLNGVGSTDTSIVQFYKDPADGAKRQAYLLRIIDRMDLLFNAVHNEWLGTFRDEFISKTGLDISSSTSKMVNGLVLHYERFIRSGKIGIPSGVLNGGIAAPEKSESYYRKGLSKSLLLKAHNAYYDFFTGNSFNGKQAGTSLQTYLDALGAKDNASGKLLSTIITEQMDLIKQKIEALNPDIAAQISNDPSGTNDLYNAMQTLVRLLKVDMTSAMSITITYTDNDGD
jgi:predicted lipoprotein